MRPIKFRAWDTRDKEMWLDFENTTEWENKDDDRWVLMQFTGLTDKNGKQIYEGDIVMITLDEEQFKIVVEWENGKDFQGYSLGYKAEPMEVIGNVYETHELSQGVLVNNCLRW